MRPIKASILEIPYSRFYATRTVTHIPLAAFHQCTLAIEFTALISDLHLDMQRFATLSLNTSLTLFTRQTLTMLKSLPLSHYRPSTKPSELS